MKKEIGKWLLDVAKYIITAVVITSIFELLPIKLSIGIGVVTVICIFVWGIYFIKDKKEK